MPKVTFLPEGTEVDVRNGLSVFAAAIEADAGVESQCGGRGGCALCRVIVREGADNLSPMEWEEEAHLGNVFHVTQERLACQSRILGDVVIEVPEPTERNKRPYVPHRFRKNLAQQVQSRMEAAEGEQDSVRSVRGKTRRRRRGKGRGPLESTGEVRAVASSELRSAPADSAPGRGTPELTEEAPPSPAPESSATPRGSSPDEPTEPPRRRRRRRRRRRGGSGTGAPGSGGGGSG
ncbi:MAG: 2Fe-2S iron-sulfur cluster-binding protein [Myxococcota bacterium]|jgi:ferredoxin|nr:2Fe-2S iron-sulfur cluster-binding protein [Myxococcota bacterium]